MNEEEDDALIGWDHTPNYPIDKTPGVWALNYPQKNTKIRTVWLSKQEEILAIAMMILILVSMAVVGGIEH